MPYLATDIPKYYPSRMTQLPVRRALQYNLFAANVYKMSEVRVQRALEYGRFELYVCLSARLTFEKDRAQES